MAAHDTIISRFDSRILYSEKFRQVAFDVTSAMHDVCKQKKCINVPRNVWKTWYKFVINVNFIKWLDGHSCQEIFRLPSQRSISASIVGECF